MYKFLIADDHPLFRGALRLVIDERWPDAEVIEVSNLPDALASMTDQDDIDLVLLDLNMPGVEGFSGLLTVRNDHPMLPVIVVSAEESAEVIQRALTYGALGFIPKSSSKDRMGEALTTVIEGRSYVPPELAESIEQARMREDMFGEKLALLTPAEVRVLQHLTLGKPNKILAYELNIKESTVKAHITSILRKLGVHSRTQAVLVAKDFKF